MKQENKAIEILIKVAGLLQEHQKEDKKILAGYTLAANLGEDATEISNEIARLFSSIVETEPAPTPTSKEGLTYKVECLDNSTAHYTHDKKEAYEVYAKFIIDFGDTIRLYEAPMPINDHDEIEWETIECYDADENDSKEGLEDGFTKGEWIVANSGGTVIVHDGIRYKQICLLEKAPLSITKEVEANARLIAAAPAMYEALKKASKLIFDMKDKYCMKDGFLKDNALFDAETELEIEATLTRINKD